MDSVAAIHIGEARRFVARHHYNKIMPRLTRLCVAGYEGGELVAVCTFGYGVRPLHTIKGLFPTLDVENYLEVGRLCVHDRIPRNGESWFLARAFRIVRATFPGVKIVYSWSDGIVGKPGYVYQSANFFYGGHITTEMYLSPDGTRVHPRTMQGLVTQKAGAGKKFSPRDYDTTTAMGYRKYFGYQFRYALPLCSKREWRNIEAASPIEWRRGGYPKDGDCRWMVQTAKGQRIECGAPPFVATQYIRPDAPMLALMEAKP